MIMKFLKSLVSSGGDGDAAVQAESTEYEGFHITPAPRKVEGGYSLEGVITREVDGEQRRKTFIRADVLMSADEAVRISLNKGRQIIDEQGLDLFDK